MKIDDFRTFSEKNHNKTCRKNHEKNENQNFLYFFCHWNLHKDALYRNLETPESRKYMKPRDLFFLSLSDLVSDTLWWIMAPNVA